MRDGHVFSASQVETVEKCPRQFGYRYAQRLKSKLPRGVEAFMGTRVHAIAERAEHHWALHHAVPTVEAMLGVFRREWTENMPAAGLHVAKRGMKVADYLEIGERCVRHLARVVPLQAHHPNARVIGLEVPLYFSVGGHSFMGYVDHLSTDDAGTFRVSDFKTSARPKSQAEANADTQLGLYELGLRQTYDAADVTLTWEFVATGTTVHSTRTKEQREALEAKVAGIVAKAIRTYRRQAREHKTTEQAWPARPSPLCGWCDYRDVCPDSRR